jgi:chemotaxis protein MotB
MASLAPGGRGRRWFEPWPGYVDVLSTLLMVVIFVLMVFVIAQVFLSHALTGRDEALERLNQQILELGDLLALERKTTEDLRLDIAELSVELQGSTAQRDDLQQRLAVILGERDSLASSLAEANLQLSTAGDERARLEAQVVDLQKLLDTNKQTIIVLRAEAEKNAAQLEARLKELQAAGEADKAALAALQAEAEKARAEAAAAKAESEEAFIALSAEKAKVEQQLVEIEKAYQTIDADKAKIEALLGDIAALRSLRDELAEKLLARDETAKQQEEAAAETARRLAAEQSISADAALRIEILNRQLVSLRTQLARIASALDASETKAADQEVQIADLGRRLNMALANKVGELEGYRSEFFGRLRQVLGNRPDIQVVGDRFVFQSEVLFGVGSADVGEDGRRQLGQYAQTLIEIGNEIPPEIDWILRVDGHTDARPISTFQFASNWELSAARAIAVVKHLVAQGVPPSRLVAAGFGEFRPLDTANDEIAFRRNRRIELKLDQR